jgi:hypothetical protein
MGGLERRKQPERYTPFFLKFFMRMKTPPSMAAKEIDIF